MEIKEYLEFERVNRLDKTAALHNRKKYGVKEFDLITFYGLEYPYKRNLYSKKKEKIRYKDKEIKTQLNLFNTIFEGNDNSFVRIFNKYTGEYYSYAIGVLKDEDKLKSILNSNRYSNNNDMLYTLNTYNSMRKCTYNNIFTINSFAVDLDYKEIKKYQKYSPKQMLNLLEKTEFDKTIPKPNIVEYANNIRLIYVLEKSYSTDKVLNLVKRINSVISERLADFGATAQPLTTYARIAGSLNTKNEKKVEYLYLEQERYVINNLKEIVLPPLPEWYPEYKAKTTRKKMRVIDLSINFKNRGKAYQYNLNRIEDFFKIVNYFDGDVDGRRFMCFQVRNHSKLAGMSNEKAEELLYKFNNSFRKPLKWNVIEQDTRNVERKQYYYKSEKILNQLSIEPELEELLDLLGIMSEIEYKRRHNIREKKRQKEKFRNNQGLTNTEIKRQEEFIKIAELEIKGYNLSQIARALKKDRKTIRTKLEKQYEKINYEEIKEWIIVSIRA